MTYAAIVVLFVLIGPVVYGYVREWLRARALRADSMVGDELLIRHVETGYTITIARRIPEGFPVGCDFCCAYDFEGHQEDVTADDYVPLALCRQCFVEARSDATKAWP